MKTIYVCSPYRGDVKKHKQYARQLTAAAFDAGFAPITPHLYMTECLDDNLTGDREKGLCAALAVLERCDALVFGNEYGISVGMETEIKFAIDHHIPIYGACRECDKKQYNIVDISRTIERVARFVKAAIETALEMFDGIIKAQYIKNEAAQGEQGGNGNNEQ